MIANSGQDAGPKEPLLLSDGSINYYSNYKIIIYISTKYLKIGFHNLATQLRSIPMDYISTKKMLGHSYLL